MSPLLCLIFLIFGLIVGSFLNVIVLRLHSGESVVFGRSRCLSCSKKLNWPELIPVLSFLVQRGHCRGCHSRISWQYPLVELLTGVLFVSVYLRWAADGWLTLLFYLIIVSLFIATTVYDLRHKIIPDLFVSLLVVLALLRPLFFSLASYDFHSLISDYQTVIWGGLTAGGVFFLLWLLSRGRWLGFGDVKLALAIGFLLGPVQVFSALVLAVWFGAIVGLVLIILTKTGLFGFRKYFTIKSELPFAPFIILGVLLNLLFQVNVF
ncbi:MAG TPA: prepilin peptidase [Candidatus Paceibacterota bacterium]|jgi:prepilin signal peptidase PulO-like enzyme (type II secretory pathway)|nr:prepilin peptidase [Candidatus Paceibacterota bacterium]